MTENRKKPQGDVPERKNTGILVLMAVGLLLIAVAGIFFFRPGSDRFVPEVRGGASLKVTKIMGGPEMKLDGQKVDFGEVPVGQQVEVTYTIQNVGDQDLQFKEIPFITIAEGC